MTFSEVQREILTNAYLLSLQGRGQVLEPWALPDAHELCEAGWLDRKVDSGELSWWWSDKAEGALKLNQLVEAQSHN